MSHTTSETRVRIDVILFAIWSHSFRAFTVAGMELIYSKTFYLLPVVFLSFILKVPFKKMFKPVSHSVTSNMCHPHWTDGVMGIVEM